MTAKGTMSGSQGSGHQPAAAARLAEGNALLAADPAAALAVADGLLQTAPALPQATLLAGQALRRLGRHADAIARLAPLAAAHPRVPAVQWELAQAAAAAGDSPRAIAALTALTAQVPEEAGGWFLLASQQRAMGDAGAAWRADLAGVNAAARDPLLVQAAMAMQGQDFAGALARLDARAAKSGEDAPSTRLRGEIAWRLGDMAGAIPLVEQALALAPGFDMAREFLVRLLLQSNRLTEALAHAETLQASPVASPGHKLLLASVKVRLGDQAGAAALYREVLATHPAQPLVWQNLGHVLKTLGQQADAVAAYRQAVTLQPHLGEAWWSLANLKTVKLDAADRATMTAALADVAPERTEDRFHLHFALGKALEDAGEAEAAFAAYHQGNALRRSLLAYSAADFSAEVDATIAAFPAPFLAAAGQGGVPARDPIFIVGLPRSGSTLVEQILASHSQIEGTMELPDLMMIASRLAARVDAGEFADLPALYAGLGPDDRRRLGEEYLDRTRIHRQQGRPRFIDTMPNNWQHIGLIRLILPHATIIDARRHPMGCCFSGWKQHFARGQGFSYDLADIGQYYRDYVRLMAHFDAVAPGLVHRVIYEEMVADTESQVRRLLAACGMDFEPACLTFWQTERAVRTASSEQVRRPIFTDGVDQWQRFAPWLGPLEAALGDVVTAWPEVPESLRAVI